MSSFEILALAQTNFNSNRPLCQCNNSGGTTTSVASGTPTAIKYDTNVYDTYSGHSTVTNNTRYTGQVPGIYRVVGLVQGTYGGAPGANTTISAQVYLNGSAITGSKNVNMLATAAGVGITAYTEIYVTLNGTSDYVEIFCTQNSGQTLTTTATAANACNMMAEWIHQ